jgi:hypothetical protein
MENRRYYILNYAFIISLLLLAVNDHVLKSAFGNWITGKLSDLAGMVVLPLMLAFIFPKLKIYAIWLSAILFAIWKSPLSEGIIQWYNQYALIGIERVVDYTDLGAFTILPLPYFIIKDKSSVQLLKIQKFTVSPMYLVIPCIFILLATAPPKSYYYSQGTGNLNFYKTSVKVHYTEDEILQKFKSMGMAPVRDSVSYGRSTTWMADKKKIHYYRIPLLVFDSDTLKDLELSFDPDGDKTRIYLASVNIEKDLNDEEVKKKLRKYYSKVVKQYFKRTLKD